MVGTVASAVLGIVFVVAGGSKLAAGQRWPREASGLGAPAAVVPVLPWLELVLGALLLAQLGRPWVAVVATLTLLAFTALIVIRLREGRRPPCACFGAWSSRPLGWTHIARNTVFVAVGVAAIVA